MGYPEQGAHLDPGGAIRHFDRTSGLTTVTNGRQSPLAEATERASQIAAEANELIARGHTALDRIAGQSEDRLLERSAPLGTPRSEKGGPPALELLSDAVSRNGHNLDPLRGLVNRLEAL